MCVEVLEKYYLFLCIIGLVNFKIFYDNKVYELKELNGCFLLFGKLVGENLFYVLVIFEFDNKGDIILGLFVEVYLLLFFMENVLLFFCMVLIEE